MPDVSAVKTLALEEVAPSGEKTVADAALTAGDRCVLTQQADTLENDVSVVSSGAWLRAGEAPDPEGGTAALEALSGALDRLRSWRDGGEAGGGREAG